MKVQRKKWRLDVPIPSSPQLLYLNILQLLPPRFNLAHIAANFTEGAGDRHTTGGVSVCLPRDREVLSWVRTE